jgi:hypothetical protein
MLSEKDLWYALPSDLQSSLEPILDRYQRHLMILEAEVAELRKALPQLYALLNQQSRTALSSSTAAMWLPQNERTKKS